MKSTIIKIEGMNCTRCAQTIKAVVTAEIGVQAAEVSFEEGQARVLYDPKTTDEGRLAAAIKRAGFRVPA